MLLYIGGKMLLEGIKNREEEAQPPKIGFAALFIQGVATSIDALSVGFTIAGYGLIMAILCALIIAAVTFVICLAGLGIGKKAGTQFSNQAVILGGVILIVIGFEIFLKGVL